MQTKLTLRMEETLIARAKEHAERSGKSVSQMVSDYFSLLEPGLPGEEVPLTPLVRALRGALRDDEDYRRHLRRKHL